MDRSPGTASFACVGDQVVFTLRADSGRTQRVETRVQYTNNPKRKSSSDELSVNVPYSTAQITCGDYDRTIKSELETLVWGCLQYGEYDLSDGSTIWAREIDYEWTMYPGWPSLQNKFRTIPMTGSPEWHGYFSAQKQNGIFPPTVLAYSAFSNYGNQVTTGWAVGGITDTGSHSAGLSDTVIVDAQKGFNEYFGGTILTHRFYCDEGAERCYYPNGEEAGL